MPERSVLPGLLAAAALAVCASTPTTAATAHYILEPAKSTLEFSFMQAGAPGKGHFKIFSTTLDFAPENPAEGHLEVVVDMGSFDTADKDRNDTLRGPDLFDVAKSPQARFTATSITRAGDGFDAAGKLTLRGVTREVHVPFSFRTSSEQGQTVSYLTGKTTIKRLDFGVGQGEWKSTDWVGNDVVVTYTLRLVSATR